MNEITKVILENEMDLILAHKQSMKLGEICGLSLSSQTTFATAVSEISRCLVDKENHASLSLQVSSPKIKNKQLLAILESRNPIQKKSLEDGLRYAKKLVSSISRIQSENGMFITLELSLAPTFHISNELIENWRIILNNDPAVSPYEEIKRKNRQLMALAEKLKLSEMQYKSLADSLPIMIYTFKNTGELIYANKWMLDYTGSTIEELNKTKFSNVYHPDDFAEIWNKWHQETAVHKKLQTRERKLKNDSGEYRWHTGVAIPIKDSSDNVLYWNSFMVDIHAQKIIEETLKDNKELKETKIELEEKVELLNRSNKLLEQFAFVTSHDLQEPLRKISFFSNYLKSNFNDNLGEKGIKYLDKLVNETNRTRDLIKDILHYSTFHSEKGNFETLELNTILNGIVEDMDLIIQEKGAIINIEPLPSIQGNKVQIMQLFANLISNAIKFVNSGTKPLINISVHENKDNFLISITDNGIGVEEQYQRKIFELFQRLHPKDEFSGTGIGLSICNKIMEFHNGRISLKSSLGNGSTFILEFEKSI